MPAARGALLLPLLLGACLALPPASPEAPPADPVPADPMPAAEPGAAAATLTAPPADALAAPTAADEASLPAGAGAAPHPAAAPPPLPPPLPPALVAEDRACTARGGTLRPRGGGLWACIRQTRDGGARCASAAECEGLCLARSRTCAPFEPLFGCHEVLDASGRPQTLCRE